MLVKDLFIHLRADQIVYFETRDGHYIEHGPIARIWHRYQDCMVGMISCNNPYKSLFVGIVNPPGTKIFQDPEEGSIW